MEWLNKWMNEEKKRVNEARSAGYFISSINDCRISCFTFRNSSACIVVHFFVLLACALSTHKFHFMLASRVISFRCWLLNYKEKQDGSESKTLSEMNAWNGTKCETQLEWGSALKINLISEIKLIWNAWSVCHLLC